jgi:AcrR family transcriptional regulator
VRCVAEPGLLFAYGMLPTMPSPPKTSSAEIVAAARKLVEQRGRDGFTMNDVARAVGVRTPSLYGRFADRATLLAAVELELWHELERALAAAPRSSSPVRTLTAQARAYRSFARAHPRAYALMYETEAERSKEGVRARAAALAPTLPSLVALVGEAQALAAARVLTPFLHGFVSMENNGAFRLGGGLEEAFENGVVTILKGLQRTRRASRHS